MGFSSMPVSREVRRSPSFLHFMLLTTRTFLKAKGTPSPRWWGGEGGDCVLSDRELVFVFVQLNTIYFLDSPPEELALMVYNFLIICSPSRTPHWGGVHFRGIMDNFFGFAPKGPGPRRRGAFIGCHLKGVVGGGGSCVGGFGCHGSGEVGRGDCL